MKLPIPASSAEVFGRQGTGKEALLLSRKLSAKRITESLQILSKNDSKHELRNTIFLMFLFKALLKHVKWLPIFVVSGEAELCRSIVMETMEIFLLLEGNLIFKMSHCLCLF